MILRSLIFVMFIATRTSDVDARENIQWIMIRYPGLADDYVKQLKDYKRIPSHFSLIDMNKEKREEICKEITAAVVFQYRNVNDWRSKLIPREKFNYASLVSRVVTFYEEGLLPSFHKFLLTVEVGQMIILLYAVPCSILDGVGDSWFLAAGFDEKSLLVLTRRNGSTHYLIRGHVEPSPVPNQLDLEECFIRDLQNVAEISPKRSVCSLDAIQKFRLCSSVFNVYAKDENKVVNYFRGNPECMKNTRITFTSLDPSVTATDEPILVDLLPCAVNQEWFSPIKYYVTADPKVWHAVYVVARRFSDESSSDTRDRSSVEKLMQRKRVNFNLDPHEFSDEPPRTSSASSKRGEKYCIVMHVKEINVLRYEPL